MKKFAFILLALVGLHCLGSWGFLVHRTVNQLAIYELPKGMRPFFYHNREYLVKESVRPDQRRSSDPAEATKHFIDFEAYGDSAAWKMPWTWAKAVQLYSKDTLLKYGHVPYVIVTVKEKLTEAFRKKNEDSILFYAADMGHYIGDAHVPLHTSINYDGQLTNQKGLHSLWESMIPEIELAHYNLSTKHRATYLREPEEKIWAMLRHAHVLVQDVFRLEKEVSENFTPEQKYRTQIRRGKEVKSYSTGFAQAYSERLGATINEQLISSANLIADLWYTCWVDAGKPDLSLLHHSSYRKAEKKALRKEVRLFKKNSLLKNKKLIARKDQEETTE